MNSSYEEEAHLLDCPVCGTQGGMMVGEWEITAPDEPHPHTLFFVLTPAHICLCPKGWVWGMYDCDFIDHDAGCEACEEDLAPFQGEK